MCTLRHPLTQMVAEIQYNQWWNCSGASTHFRNATTPKRFLPASAVPMEGNIGFHSSIPDPMEGTPGSHPSIPDPMEGTPGSHPSIPDPMEGTPGSSASPSSSARSRSLPTLSMLPLSIHVSSGPPTPITETLFHSPTHSKLTLPTLTLYGPTNLPSAPSVSLTVHGYFPYILIRPPLPPSPTPMWDDPTTLSSFLPILYEHITTRVQSLKPSLSSDLPVVHDLSIVKGTPFYSYSPEPLHFIKIRYYSAEDRWRIRKILEGDAPGNRWDKNPGKTYPVGNFERFHTYLGHLPLTTMFLSDCRTSGASWTTVGDYFLRLPCPDAVPGCRWNEILDVEGALPPYATAESTCTFDADTHFRMLNSEDVTTDLLETAFRQKYYTKVRPLREPWLAEYSRCAALGIEGIDRIFNARSSNHQSTRRAAVKSLKRLWDAGSGIAEGKRYEDAVRVIKGRNNSKDGDMKVLTAAEMLASQDALDTQISWASQSSIEGISAPTQLDRDPDADEDEEDEMELNFEGIEEDDKLLMTLTQRPTLTVRPTLDYDDDEADGGRHDYDEGAGPSAIPPVRRKPKASTRRSSLLDATLTQPDIHYGDSDSDSEGSYVSTFEYEAIPSQGPWLNDGLSATATPRANSPGTSQERSVQEPFKTPAENQLDVSQESAPITLTTNQYYTLATDPPTRGDSLKTALLPLNAPLTFAIAGSEMLSPNTPFTSIVLPSALSSMNRGIYLTLSSKPPTRGSIVAPPRSKRPLEPLAHTSPSKLKIARDMTAAMTGRTLPFDLDEDVDESIDEDIDDNSVGQPSALTDKRAVEKKSTNTHSISSPLSSSTNPGLSSASVDPLANIGQQGGRLHINALTPSGLKQPTATTQPMTIMTIETFSAPRMSKKGVPLTLDPALDPIHILGYTLHYDPGNGNGASLKVRGVLSLDPIHSSPAQTEELRSERALLLRLAALTRAHDPDVLVSWDTLANGIGHVVERGRRQGEGKHIDMVRLLGRTPTKKQDEPEGKSGDTTQGQAAPFSDWDEKVGAGALPSKIVGRIVICAWRVMSEEIKHPNVSSLHAVTQVVINKTLPDFSKRSLLSWYENRGQRHRVASNLLDTCMATILVLDAVDVLGRSGEAARLSQTELIYSIPGMRGSQYKVEGVLVSALKNVNQNEKGMKGKRASIGHTFYSETLSSTQPLSSQNDNVAGEDDEIPDLGYLFQSPSKVESNSLEALQAIPMVIEPESRIYHDPVVVMDFTALYPSLVIAYNLCYSTVAGRITYQSSLKKSIERGHCGTTGRVGMVEYPESMSTAVMEKYMPLNGDDSAYVVPSGGIFVGADVKRGVLPQVLDEILETRAMIKRCMKVYKGKDVPPSLFRTLEAKQLALKYVANVTYGYTSATFSGRCACPVVADAIVELARRTLSSTMDLCKEWGKEGGRWSGARVVYGDTDSVFVQLPGRSVAEAFTFGETFCAEVTRKNPPPVNLKLEKVYGSCMLQTKKRYAGMMFTDPGQSTPTFEAKGIEVIRKDQCRLTQKILRGALITMFRTKKESKLREYLEKQWIKLLSGSLPPSDFVLTGRVRSSYRSGGATVQAALADRLAESDPGVRMKNKERISYVIISSPGRDFKLKDNVVTPLELLEQYDRLSPHLVYYAKRQLNAALQRSFGLPPYSVNVEAWFDACPKPSQRPKFWPVRRGGPRSVITAFFGSDTCSVCRAPCKARSSDRAVACGGCRTERVGEAAVWSLERLKKAEGMMRAVDALCRDCHGCQADDFGVDRGGGKGVRLPMSVCENLDCDVFYRRHRIREMVLEAEAVSRALDLF